MTIETANRLFELRKKHNLSQEELAEKLGVSRQAVSKWERSEASPDTDNLIALAQIYGLTLDELIYGEKEKAEENKTEPEASDKEGLYIDIEDKKEKVKIGPCGIVVESDDGDKVKIDFNGIKIHTSKSDEYANDDDDQDLDDNGITISKNGHINLKVGKSDKKLKFWLEVPYAIICAIAYLIFGFYDIFGGFGLSWIVFITIPIYYSLVEAIYKRRFSDFAYPVLTAFIYLYLGLYQGNWHPSWIIFITIAIYYPIAEAIDKKIMERRRSKTEKIG